MQEGAAKLPALESEVAGLKKSLEEKEAALAQAQAQAAELAQLKEKSSGLETQLAELKAGAEQLKATQEKAAALEAELKAAQDKLTEAQNAQQNQQGQAQAAALEAQLAELKAGAEQLKAAQDKAAALETELKAAQDKLTETAQNAQQNQQTQTQEQTAQLTAELEAGKTKTTELEQKLAALQAELDALRSKAEQQASQEQNPVQQAPVDSDGDSAVDADDLCPDTPAGTAVNKMGCPETSKSIVLSGVTFALGTANLTKEAQESLTATAALLQEAVPNKKFEIAGYTDNSGNPERNQIVSGRRAEAVRNFLVSKGIKKELMVSKGYGSANSVADNGTEDGRAKNRRVELHLLD
jgi:outer membrane protein OmpA-like peptidoglycan-associated protein